MIRPLRPLLHTLALLWLASSGPASPSQAEEQRLQVQEIRLDNGMTFLLVPRPQTTTVAAGWVVPTGSADESPGQTGLSHMVEHMLFKGSRSIGTRDAAAEAAVLAEQDEVWAEIRKNEARDGGRARRRLDELRDRFADLQQQARSLAFLGEFSFRYSEAGGVGLNANTLPDLTFYWVTLPTEKLELWFWLESDRLREPVFREFYKEKSVIAEERRQRIDSRPTGRVDSALREELWAGTSYAWAPIGREGDLDELSRADLEAFFAATYRPERLTAVLVGDLDAKAVAAWARSYFGRWRADSAGPIASPYPSHPAPDPFEISLPGNSRSRHACECPAQARVQYMTVPFGHPDSYALQLLAGVLNGRSGRLHRELVLEREIAFAAGAGQYASRRAGYFGFEAETRGEHQPDELVVAWDAIVSTLIEEEISSAEIERVKNQVTADAYRRLKEPTDLMRRLLVYQGMGAWREIEEWPRRILALGAKEVRDSATRYLAPERRRVALIYRGSLPEQP